MTNQERVDYLLKQAANARGAADNLILQAEAFEEKAADILAMGDEDEQP